MNEDGHVLKSRRGLLAAGLAVVVVGALGVASTMSAGAEQVPGDQDATQAPVAVAGDATADASVPPVSLPWGTHPVRAHRGKAGASSRTLHDQGLQAASDDSGRHVDFSPKGRSTRTTFVKSEQTDVQPPAPAPSASATTTDPATTSPTTAATTTPATQPTSAAPTTQATTAVNPPAPADTPSTADTTTPPATSAGKDGTVNFLYSVATQAVTADGFYASMDIENPVLAKGDYHTLAELAVQSSDSQQVVEVGWNVDRGVNGDDYTHLFVYHWVNGQTTCYNTCGFTPYDGGVKPGDILPADTTKKFGIQYFNGAWWIAYDTTWVGYFADKEWSSQGITFNKVGLVQTFGEVAASSAKPCTQMGNGVVADDSGAARIGSITYLNGPTVAMNMRSTSDVYGLVPLSTRTFRYGGPGAC